MEVRNNAKLFEMWHKKRQLSSYISIVVIKLSINKSIMSQIYSTDNLPYHWNRSPWFPCSKLDFGWIILSHTLLGIWLLIHVVVKVTPCWQKGPQMYAGSLSMHNVSFWDRLIPFCPTGSTSKVRMGKQQKWLFKSIYFICLECHMRLQLSDILG